MTVARRLACAPWCLALCVAVSFPGKADAQTPPDPALTAAPFPYYNAEQALQGVYRHRLPTLAKAFEQSAAQLVSRTEAHCQGQASLTELRTSWLQTLVHWQALSSPEIGPLVARRSQREIDFWPARERLLRQALAKAPQTLADMERVGTPAKGFPAYEQLLAATHTPWAPWTIVPADSKTHRNLMIATVLREVLSNLELKYPPGAPALEKIKVK